jgi:hypothetical protein
MDSTSSMEEIAMAQLFAALPAIRTPASPPARDPPCQGLRAKREQLPLPTDNARVATSQQKMMPRTDLCNRLVVTSIR